MSLRKGRDLNPRVNKSTCRISSPVLYQAEPPFQRCGKRDLNPHAQRAHAPEACVSAVPPFPQEPFLLYSFLQQIAVIIYGK
jgi:hypothetical protein